MKSPIELFTSLTGWTSTGTISASSLNTIPDFISNNLPSSVIFHVPAGNKNKSVTKTISFVPTGYDEIILSIWSRNKHSGNSLYEDEYDYKIKFQNSGMEYYLPIHDQFTQIHWSISGQTTFDRITITSLHDDDDYLVLSGMYAIKEELPLDIFTSAKETLRSIIDTDIDTPVGTMSGFVGDSSISISANFFLERYCVIKITSISGTEYHHIEKTDELSYKFSDLYDGKTLLYNHTNATVSLYIPVEYGVDSKEVVLPSITIWGMTPEMVLRGSALEDIIDTSRVDNHKVSMRREGHIYNFNLLIDCEARHYSLISLMASAVRKFLGREKIWINGRKFDVVGRDSPTYVEPTQAYEIIPKIQYNCTIEYKEELFSRVELTRLGSTNIDINIS